MAYVMGISDWSQDGCSSDLDNVAGVERDNVATEQGGRTGSNQGQREAASMLGLSVDETSRRIGFINALSGEARSTAISQLSRAKIGRASCRERVCQYV